MIKKIRVTVDGKTYDATVEIPEEAPPVAPTPAPAAVAAPPSPAAPTPPPSSAPAGAGDVPSPLAGHVIAVTATLGQSVKRGDPMVTVEAMKMNTFVMAPIDGKVAAINVKVGDVVNEGQVLVRIE